VKPIGVYTTFRANVFAAAAAKEKTYVDTLGALETKFFDIFLSIIFFSRQCQKEDVGKEDVGKEDVGKEDVG
jgi:hypothetical protein